MNAHHQIDRLIDARDELAVVLRYSEIDPIARDRIVAAYTTLRQVLVEMTADNRAESHRHIMIAKRLWAEAGVR